MTNREKKPIVTACPNCRKSVSYNGPGENTCFPFCSRRCKMVDLDRWLEEEHKIESAEDHLDDNPES